MNQLTVSNMEYSNSITISEKLQCLKFEEYFNNPIIAQCIDKYRIRKYLIEKNLSELIPELYGMYDAPRESIEMNYQSICRKM